MTHFTNAQFQAIAAVAMKQEFQVYEKDAKKVATAAFMAAPCEMHNQHVIDMLEVLQSEHKASPYGHDNAMRELLQSVFKKGLQEYTLQIAITLKK